MDGPREPRDADRCPVSRPAGAVPGVRHASGRERRAGRRPVSGLPFPPVRAVHDRVAHGAYQVLALRFDERHRVSRDRRRQRSDQGRIVRRVQDLSQDRLSGEGLRVRAAGRRSRESHARPADERGRLPAQLAEPAAVAGRVARSGLTARGRGGARAPARPTAKHETGATTT
ncbi:hypothetical protein F01_420540 [Burkholderia cenocepacia]|nr:hypothetical protein F01_420540 [Burkholderia cenocepacia]